MSTVTASHEILILGGNFAGVGCVHYLMRRVVPSLQGIKVHITLVSPNTHLFFKIASPRAITDPGLLEDGRIWKPLTEALSQYETAVTHVQGVAVDITATKRQVTVEAISDREKPLRSLHYDSLLIATGTTSTSPLWTLHTDQSRTLAALTALYTALTKAKSVLIAGGGPVGVETAGEIAKAHPDCKVTLLSGDVRLLRRARPEVGERAAQILRERFAVDVIHNLRVRGTNLPITSDGSEPATVTLSDGSTRDVDLYIPATGGAPNAHFLPSSWLDEGGRVHMRDEHFRVRGDGAEFVYVVGDVASGSENTAIELEAMVPTVCTAMGADIAATTDAGKKTTAHRGWLATIWALITGAKAESVQEKPFKPIKNTMLVPISAEGGVGVVMGWMVPSGVVRLGKSKSFLVEMVGPMISGKKW